MIRCRSNLHSNPEGSYIAVCQFAHLWQCQIPGVQQNVVTNLEGCVAMSLVHLVLLASLCLLQPGPHHVVDSSYVVGKVSSSWLWAKSLQKISGFRRFLAIGHVKWGVPHTVTNG